MTKIKICGITKASEAAYLNEAKVDYAGFVFYEKSKRNINIEKAREIFKVLDKNIKKVAVMVSPSIQTVEELMNEDFDIFQIHGSLSEEVIRLSGKPIWYAINIEDEKEASDKLGMIEELPDNLNKKIEGYVVDAPKFGSGQTFNWQKSKRLKKAGTTSPPDKMFILAGGLNAENVAEGIELFNPDVVDISSNAEGQNGKDRALILDFVNATRRLCKPTRTTRSYVNPK